MSLFRRVLGLEPPCDRRPRPPRPRRRSAVAVGETESVRRIAARLEALPPARARFVAAFAYLLGAGRQRDRRHERCGAPRWPG